MIIRVSGLVKQLGVGIPRQDRRRLSRALTAERFPSRADPGSRASSAATASPGHAASVVPAGQNRPGIRHPGGVLAASIALIGFGLDSVIEFFSALIVVWQLHGHGEERETRAVRLIGGTFFALAAYLAAASIRALAVREGLEAWENDEDP